MAKAKKKTTASAAPTSGPAGGQSGDTIEGMFPVKPKRAPNTVAPGNKVELRTNLFKMSLDQNKPIYKITADVDRESPLSEPGQEAKKEAPKGEGAATGPTDTVKIGNEHRRKAVEEALKIWIKDIKVKLPASYCIDGNGSIIYALFNPFSGQASHEVRVALELKTIFGGELVNREKFFKVKFHNCSPLDVKRLFDFCAGTISANNQSVAEEIRALNVLVRGKISTIPGMVLTKYNVFPFTPNNQFDASVGVQVDRGFSTSVRPAECGVILNVANTIGSFHKPMKLIELLQLQYQRQIDNNSLPTHAQDWLKRELKNKQIEARHIKYGTNPKEPHYRKYRVSDIGGSAMDKFTLVDSATKTSREVTIYQYFKERYNLTLRYPKLPCVIDKGNKIPLEVCHLIEKQKVIRKMDPDETAKIIKETALRPRDHFDLVDKNANFVKGHSKPLEDFGISFSIRPIDVTGRELFPISLLASRNFSISPKNGEYMAKGAFFKPALVQKWVLTFLIDDDIRGDKQRNGSNDLFQKRFDELYVEAGRFKGVNVGSAIKCNQIPIGDERMLKETLGKYVELLNKNKVDHSIIVLPRRCPDWVYRYLQYLEVTATGGRPTTENWTRLSCVKYANYVSKIMNDRFNGRMFLSNLWLKYNTKLGGINFVLDPSTRQPYLGEGVIFLSVDVCHPAPGDKLIQSVAAVVGMWDLTNAGMSHCTRLRVQAKVRENKSTIEEVGDIGPMFEEVLDSYYAKKKKYPSVLIILRDGVSEGQLEIVLKKELGRVKASLKNKYTNAKLPMPKMTCLVVQKRHKVRFMRKDPVKDFKGNLDYNIQPGTVVDSVITHPTDFSFYLAPHKAIQGTSRAAHIYIICDEMGFSQDLAQSMVHALSYLSPRCTKSTSIPTPVNLADLAAERGKNLVISWNDANGHKMSEDQRLKELNKFLSNMGDQRYKNTLYYI